MSRKSMWRGVAAAVALTVAGAGCGSGGDKDETAESKESSRYDVRASASDVSAGLGKIETVAGQVALAVSADAKAAREQAEGIEALWEPIEGTIRANDKDLYIRFEDDFAALKQASADADTAKANATGADVAEAVKAYRAKFAG